MLTVFVQANGARKALGSSANLEIGKGALSKVKDLFNRAGMEITKAEVFFSEGGENGSIINSEPVVEGSNVTPFGAPKAVEEGQ